MNEYYSVSRIEDETAVVEFPNGSFNEVPVSLLPSDVKEGSILVLSSDGTYIHDFSAEEDIKNRLLSFQDDIFG